MASHPMVSTPWRETESSCECDPNVPITQPNSTVDEKTAGEGIKITSGSPNEITETTEPVSVGGILQEFFIDLGLDA